LVPAQPASTRLIKPSAEIRVDEWFMGQFLAGGIEIDVELPIDMNSDASASRHEDRIEALGLALLEPLSSLFAATGDGLAQHEGAGVAGDTTGHTAGVTHDRGSLGTRCRFSDGLNGHHTNSLGKKRRGIGLLLAGDTGNALFVRDSAQWLLRAATLVVQVIVGGGADGAVFKDKGDRVKTPRHA